VRTRSGSALALVLAVAGALVPAAAGAFQAAPAPGSPGALRVGSGAVTFALDASVGLLEGTARELVFDYPLGTKFKVSELTWDLKDVAMAGLTASAGFGPRVRLNASVWSALNDGSGSMRDRDWLYTSYFEAGLISPDNIGEAAWTDESRHPDTSVDTARAFDVNVCVSALQSGSFSLSGIAGWKWQKYRWSARGGTATYTPMLDASTADLAHFREFSYEFTPGVEVVAYEQTFSIPYLGLSAAWAGPALRLEGHVLLSALVSAEIGRAHV
jgi:plasminogen activator